MANIAVIRNSVIKMTDDIIVNDVNIFNFYMIQNIKI